MTKRKRPEYKKSILINLGESCEYLLDNKFRINPLNDDYSRILVSREFKGGIMQGDERRKRYRKEDGKISYKKHRPEVYIPGGFYALELNLDKRKKVTSQTSYLIPITDNPREGIFNSEINGFYFELHPHCRNFLCSGIKGRLVNKKFDINKTVIEINAECDIDSETKGILGYNSDSRFTQIELCERGRKALRYHNDGLDDVQIIEKLKKEDSENGGN